MATKTPLNPVLSSPKPAVESAQEPEITCQYKEVKFTSSKGTLILEPDPGSFNKYAETRRCNWKTAGCWEEVQHKSKQQTVYKFPVSSLNA